MSEYNLDMQTYQWYFFIPWMLFYIIYCLKERIKIGEEERVGPMKRPIIHWIILGLSIVYMATQSNDLEKLQSLYYAFIIFSLWINLAVISLIVFSKSIALAMYSSISLPERDFTFP